MVLCPILIKKEAKMALSVTEGTKQQTMDIISEVVGVPIKYARIFARWVTRDNHPGGAFTATLDCYVEDNPPADKITPLHHEFGCNIPASAIDAMAGTDDRQVLYKHVEYIVNYQAAERRRNDDPEGFDPVAENAELDALAAELGIDTFFRFNQ